MEFLHLSDLHFHRSSSKNKKINSTLKKIKDKYPEHYLILTGDVADDGNERQFKNAQTALMPFKGRLFICPGNHDFGAVGLSYNRDRANDFDEYLSIPLKQNGRFAGDNDPVVNVVTDKESKTMLIALDTNLETPHCFDIACGEIGKRQLKALRSIITGPGSNEYVKILFFHHHPFMHNDPTMRLKDSKALAQTIFGQVDVVMFGHRHVSGLWEGVYGASYVLSADNTPGKKSVREVTVKGRTVSVQDVPVG